MTGKQAAQHPWFNVLNELIMENSYKKIGSNGVPQAVASALAGLVKHQLPTKFHEAVLSFLCHRCLNREQLENTQIAFLEIDADLDGYINQADLEKAFTTYYFTGKDEFADDEGCEWETAEEKARAMQALKQHQFE